MTHALHNSLVRILGADGAPVGVGFLAAPQVIVTCAHVVQQAAGDSAEVTFDFPLLAPAERRSGRVVIRDEAADLAAIEPLSLPRGAAPVRLVQSDDLWGHPFRAFGCPVAGKRVGKIIETREVCRFLTVLFVTNGPNAPWNWQCKTSLPISCVPGCKNKACMTIHLGFNGAERMMRESPLFSFHRKASGDEVVGLNRAEFDERVASLSLK